MSVMMDSGAFTLRRAKKWIDPKPYLAAYIDYCRANKEHVEVFVSLDVIPGTRGQDGVPMRTDAAARAGFENWETMRAAKVDAMPVFHARERMEWLERYAAAGCRWIGLASAHAGSVRRRRVWLRACFGLLAKFPRVERVHGFAETEISIVTDFAWFSVDSRTASDCAIHGQIFVPTRNGDGDWILGLYFVGEPTGKNAARQLSAQCPAVREAVLRRVDGHGFTIEMLSVKRSKNRAIYNALEYERIVRERAVNPNVRIFQATDPRHDPFLGRGDVPDRLISFDAIRRGKFHLGAFVRGLSW